MQNPLTLLLKTMPLVFAGRLHFISDLKDLSFEQGKETFNAFRKVVVDPSDEQPFVPCAILKVQFTFKNLSASANRHLSLLPIPLILGQQGFRSKTWFLGESSGDFIGLYEFDTIEEAKAYRDSLPLLMMRQRARSGSITVEVVKNFMRRRSLSTVSHD